jgi:hypothetical protein
VRDLGEFLAEAMKKIVAGSIVHDFHPATDPDVWARNGAAYGGLVGLVAWWHAA